ncbi:MAG: NCS2 family permease [Mycobacteriales bacterium]|nr:MAG: hypothetical protein DLM56_05200 [Pseudonocardiales bacterium]
MGGPEGATRLDRYFRISARGSTVRTELRGGLVTFFTMAYIVVLNPLIIGTQGDGIEHKMLGIGRVAAVTALVAAVMTIAMGVVGRYPFAIATGLGLNAFVAFSIASQMTWPEAMGLVVWEGIVITFFVATGLRKAILRAIPAELRIAIGVGIGLFISVIGLVDAGIVRRIPDASNTTVPVQLGATGTLAGWPTAVFVVGLLLMAGLMARKVRGAILIGIISTTVLAIVVESIVHAGAAGAKNPSGWQLNVPRWPHKVVGTPDLSLVGHFSLTGGFGRVGALTAVLLIFTLVLSDFFDTIGTVVGVAAGGGLLDEKGELPGLGRVLVVDSLAAVAGGTASASSATAYVESASGVGDGARTGLASVLTGGLFVVAMFFTPLVTVVPAEAATPALVVVGALMFRQISRLDFSDISVAIPALLTIVLMPFTYSITNGIGAGVVSYVFLRVVRGGAKDVHPLLWIVAVLFLAYFALHPIRAWLGIG